MNEIKTWKQGSFILRHIYKRKPNEWKEKQMELEKHLVRPSATGNAICSCNQPTDAKWIASRLNLASILEDLTYDYATGKTDGEELRDFVLYKINGS